MDTSSKNETNLGEFTSYWRIENFFIRELSTELELVSPLFKDNIYNNEWHLSLRENMKGYLGLYLNKTNDMAIEISFSLSLLASSGWVEIHATKKRFTPEEQSFGIHFFIRWERMSDNEWTYLPSGCLTVNCRIWNDECNASSAQCVMISRLKPNLCMNHFAVHFYTSLRPDNLLLFPASYIFSCEGKDMTEPQQKDEKPEKIDSESISIPNIDSDEIKNLMANFSDIKYEFATLRTHHRDFVVHKAILCAKSPVLHAMLDKQKNENGSNLLEIDDIDSDAISSIIQLIHLEPVDLNWISTVKLYFAVNKLEIETLKKTCMNLLEMKFSVENIGEAFILANTHKDKDLIQLCLKYFTENMKKILISKEWKEFLKNNCKLGSKILCHMAKD